jgi:hypothetical protein
MFDKLIDVQVTKDITEDLKNSLKELKNKMVCIGVPQEDDAARSSNQKEHITNAQLLYIHTNGVRDNTMIKEMQHDINSGKPYSRAYEFYVQEHGSPLFKVPPRPVLAPAIENSKDKIAEQMKQAFQSVLEGGNITTELGKVGMLGQNICREWFTDPSNKWAANSPLTIKKKGSDKPLIDTGALRRSITWVLRDDSND